jgi:hypothetical protein
MQGLDRYRRAVEQKTLKTMGRQGRSPRTYDVQVRADAAAADLFRMPVTLDSCVNLQMPDGSWAWISGLTDPSDGGVF